MPPAPVPPLVAELHAGQGGGSGGGARVQRWRVPWAACPAMWVNLTTRVEASASNFTWCWLCLSDKGSIIFAVYQPWGKVSFGSGWHHMAILCLFRSWLAMVGVAAAVVFPCSMRRKRFHAAWVMPHV